VIFQKPSSEMAALQLFTTDIIMMRFWLQVSNQSKNYTTEYESVALFTPLNSKTQAHTPLVFV
jgi:hypothetical protein